MKLILTIRSLISIILFAIITFAIAIVLLLAVFLRLKDLQDHLIMLWGKVSALVFFVKMKCYGTENIPQGGCIFLFNHSSYFDILALAGFIKGMRFGAKIELFKIPIFGAAMKSVGTLPIARNNRSEVLKVYEEAKERIYQGAKFSLSPEGGRQSSENIYPFKAGPFILAIQTKAPVVPVAIIGAFDIHSNKDILPHTKRWFSKIDMHIMPVIPTQDLNEDNKSELQLEVRKCLTQLIKASS